MALKVVRIINQPVTSNCFLLYDREVNNDCLVVDPGSEYPDELEQLLKDLNLYPKYILLTHEHFDHIWGCNYLVEKYHSKIICSVLCSEAIQDAKRNHSLFYNQKAWHLYSQANVFIDQSYSLPKLHFQALLYKNLTISF